MIELTTLGRSTLRRDGEELASVAAQKQKFALLAYLAIEGHASRDHLVALFWPERDEDKARHSLSQALYALKRELGEECVRVEGESVAAAAEACTVDAKELEEAAAAERWETVTELYRGPFLDQFYLPGSPEFESWCSSTRIRLARQACRAFRHVVERRMSAEDIPGALGMAARWATLEPLEDEAQHTLISLLARSGDRAAALEQYEAYRARLASELEVEPLEETLALVERIRAGELPDFRPLAAAERPPHVAEQEYEEPSTEAPPAAPPEQTGWSGLIAELREHRVMHVGAAYLAVAWLAMQFTSTLVEQGMLPSVVFRVALFLLAIGFPFALILAWAHELKPDAAAREPGRRRLWPQWAEQVRSVHVLWFLGALLVALLAATLLERTFIGTGDLDRNRVVVFPLYVVPEGNEAVGEDVATWVEYAFETAGMLRAIDGWYGLDEPQRAGLQPLTHRTARAQARAQGAAFYARGRVSLYEDSARVHLELHDVAGDSILADGGAADARARDWPRRLAERAVGSLLSALAPSESPIELAALSTSSQAAAQFTEGARAYRRAQFAAAFEHYRSAVEADSSFAHAALRAAQAALWIQRFSDAEQLLAIALRQPAFLAPHRAEMAYGLRGFLAGQADSAVAHFRRAISIEPDWSDAWARLGEVFYHLLPGESPLDSLAEFAFLEVYRNDPGYSPVLFHLIEIALRKGDVERAEDLTRQFRAVTPDSARLAEAELMLACVRASPDLVDWHAAVLERPNSVLRVGESLAVGGHQAQCARAAWIALLTRDTASDAWGFSRHFTAALDLQSLLAAEGRTAELAQFLEGDTLIGLYTGDFYLLDADAGVDLGDQAAAYAETQYERFLANDLYSSEVWFLGVWASRQGRAEELQAMARALADMAAESGDRADSLMARSLEARAALADGDSARAFQLLSSLTPTKKREDPAYPWESLGGEKLALAELLYARGEYADALDIAANFDAPARATSDLIYLPASLALRIRLARALGDADLERRSRARLTALGRDDLIPEVPH
jgi:DNA-binding SARP family transcriptional activator/Tfp pilus assembly protein PilF